MAENTIYSKENKCLAHQYRGKNIIVVGERHQKTINNGGYISIFGVNIIADKQGIQNNALYKNQQER